MAAEGETIGDRIRWAVETHMGITQSEFARRLDVKQPQVSRWINDASRPPNETSLKTIAEMSGVSPAWLRYGEGEAIEAPSKQDDQADEEPEGAAESGGGSSYEPDPGEYTTSDLTRELDRIARLDEGEALKILARDSLAGAIRAQWALEEARAGTARAEAIIRTDASSRTRALIAEAQRTGQIPAELYTRIPRPSGMDEIPVEPAGATLSDPH